MLRELITAVWLRIKALFRRRQLDRELDDELQFHLGMAEQKLREQGMPAEEAHFAARRAFGNTTQAKEADRETWTFAFLETLGQDLRYGLRQLRRNPGFTVVAVLTLALGIGANAAVFSLIDAVMLRTLPVRNPEQLVLLSWKHWKGKTNTSVLAVESDSGDSDAGPFSYPAFDAIRSRNEIFCSLFGFVSLGTSEIRIKGEVNLAEGEMVTGQYFSGLGVSPILGRPITDEDEKPSAPPAAVVSYGYWLREFGRSRKALGADITVDGVPFTVVGVAPPQFIGVQPGRAVDVWVPLINNPKLLPYGMDATPGGRSLFTSRDWWWLPVLGRLKPGVTPQQASAKVNLLFRASITAGLNPPPKPESIPRIHLEPAGRGMALLRKRFSKPLWILMALVGIVLLIACVNVAGMMVARSTARKKEMAVRLSLGAPGRRLVRQLLTESLLLAVMACGLGVLLAAWSNRALLLLMAGGEALHIGVHLDATVLAFTGAVSALTLILFGLAPALRLASINPEPALKAVASGASAGSRRTRLGLAKALVAAQVALSLVLLMGAGLFVRTLVNLENQELGFNPHHMLLFAMDPTTHGYKAARLIRFYGRLLEQLKALPAVRSATLSEISLISGKRDHWPISVEGYKSGRAEGVGVDLNVVGPSFFKTMGMPLLLGRGIQKSDTANSARVAVVNEAFARRFLRGGNALGHTFRFGYYRFQAGQFSPPYEIVGIVGDARYASIRKAPAPTVYLPYTQPLFALGGIHFELRVAGDPLTLVPSVQRVVHELDPELPVAEFKTQTDQISERLAQERLFARLSSLFGGLAVLLACIGLYGLLAYAVARRTNEIGIRMALGARPRDILQMTLRESLAIASAGVAIGIPMALAAAHLASSFLYGVKSWDPPTIIVTAGATIAVTLLAGLLPARRAAKVDPMVALRYE